MNITKELLLELIAKKRVHDLREIFEEYNIVDLADVVNELEVSKALFLFKILQNNVSAELFSYLNKNRQEELIQLFSGPQIKSILDNLYSDDINEFMGELPANITKFILSHATSEQRSEINMILSYPEDSAGSIMSTDYIAFNQSDNVAKALMRLRQQVKSAESVTVCYVEDDLHRLVGFIHLFDLLYENPLTNLSDIMESDVIKAETLDDQELVAKRFEKYDLDVLPVTNEKNNLVGVITVDDIIDVVHEETTEDMQKIWAIQPTEKTYLETSVVKMANSRIVWLLILMISATITGGIMASYESVLSKSVILSIFIPMLMSTAGNAGSQSATMIIRSLAIGELQLSDIFYIWKKEIGVALICGTIVGVANFFRVLIFVGEADIATSLVISLTVVISVVISSLIASTLPLAAVKLKLDPAVMAAPLITTIVDAVVLFIYFTLVQIFLF